METAATILLWLLVVIVAVPVLALVLASLVFGYAVFADKLEALWRWIRRA